MSKQTSISRRGFLGLGALAAAGSALAVTGCAPTRQGEEKLSDTGTANASGNPAWLGDEPEIGEIARTEDTDFLIIGAGCAGTAAAATASDMGLNFICCEKNASVQETREYFGGVNTKYQKEAKIEIDEAKLLNELSRYASGKCNQKLINMWIRESGETLEWFDPIMQAADKQGVLTVHTADHPTGGTDYYVPVLEHLWLTPYEPPMRNDLLADYVAAAGNPIRFGYEMVRLIHEDGKVTGAIFETDEGRVQINAANTLIATGGYPANPDMMEALSPAALACSTAASFAPNDTGDGIKAGLWAGASKDLEAAPMLFDRGAVAPGVDAGYDGAGDSRGLPGTIFQENIGSQPFMKVNRRGVRFVNESAPYDFMGNAAAQQPGGVWCQIFDANAPEDILRFDTIGCSGFAKQMMAVGMPIEEFCAASLESGIMMKADTLEELADLLGFEGDAKTAFLDQVERYNAQFDAQKDDDFGKEAYRLSAIRQAPFYGCWFGCSLLTTLDGLRINEHCQVIDEDCNVIEGLYAAGDASGSFFSGNYPEYLVGVASGRSTVQGRHVARFLAGDIA